MTQIKKKLLDKLQQDIGYQFRDESLLELALTHKSAGQPNNERLEFLGDAMLKTIVAEALFRRHSDVAEGIMTTARARLVKGKTLAEMGLQMGLDEMMILGLGERRHASPVKHSIVGDAVEALIGAIYIDSDFVSCQKIVSQWFADRIDETSMEPEYKDAKTQLQEIMQSRQLPLPNYEVVKVEGPGHRQHFTVRCSVELRSASAQGEGYNRRAAEQQAAKLVLGQLEVAASE